MARMRLLNEVAASQWGLVTTAQARRLGISRVELSRLAKQGALERMSHGVYRNTAIPLDEYAQLHAAWLSLYPGETAEQRLLSRSYDAVVADETAAWLLGAGDFVPEPYRFRVPVRKQSQRYDLRIRIKRYPRRSIVIRQGLPTTNLIQTIADLAERGVDRSLIADMLLHHGDEPLGVTELHELAGLLAPYAHKYGYGSGHTGGESFVNDLMRPVYRSLTQQLQPLAQQLQLISRSLEQDTQLLVDSPAFQQLSEHIAHALCQMPPHMKEKEPHEH